MGKRKRSKGRSRGAKVKVGVVSTEELSVEFKRLHRKCGSPRKNPKCWSRGLKRVWSDV